MTLRSLNQNLRGQAFGCRTVLAFLALPTTAAIVLVACSGASTGDLCGAGTHLAGTTCVAGAEDGGETKVEAGAADGGPKNVHDATGAHDSGSHRDGGADATTKGGDSGGTDATDAPATSEAGDGASDATRDGLSDAGVDASEASVPVSCAELNACVAGGGLPGAFEGGSIDTCTHAVTINTPGLDHSEWIHIKFAEECLGDGIYFTLVSPPTARFDLQVYESPIHMCFPDGCDAGPATMCPSPVGSSVATTDGSSAATATVGITSPGDIYVHVVAEADAGCATGETWLLGVAVD